MNERLLRLATAIYSETDGSDYEPHRAQTIAEIADWLSDGDDGAGRTVADLAAEWVEYNGR